MVECADIDRWLATEEAKVQGLRPGCAKHVVWAGQSGVKTPLSVLYIHGFSATAQELRPFPDLVAQGLGANLHFTRLTGHGQDGAALARATFAAWQADVAEAISIAQTIGDEVVIIGCSTGCTLATLALADGAQIKGLVQVSPNFGLRHWAAQTLMDMPGARYWGPYIVGRTRHFEPISDAHAAYWTTRYPTKAVFAMADAVRAAWRVDLGRIKTPAFFAYNMDDQVINAKKAKRIIARWGGPVTVAELVQGPDDDAMGHLMAGDIFSPGQTQPLVAKILDWFKTL